MKSLSVHEHLCRSHSHLWGSGEEAQICWAPGWKQVFELPQRSRST